MANEQREAAERLRKFNTNRELADKIYPNLSIGYDPLYDREVLSLAYLAEHLEDDDESITEGWLDKSYKRLQAAWEYTAIWEIGRLDTGSR